MVGLGGLAYYGMGLSDELGAVDKQMMWPQYVKDRIKVISWVWAVVQYKARTTTNVFGILNGKVEWTPKQDKAKTDDLDVFRLMDPFINIF